ncbi:hypothetical protein LTR94_025493, partial [Friedmanniomyces endolithicus]
IFNPAVVNHLGGDQRSVQIIYAVIAALVLVYAAVLSRARLPEIDVEAHHSDPTAGDAKTPLGSQTHFVLGVLTQALYVGAQVGVGAFFLNLVTETWDGLTTQQGAFMLSIAAGGYLAGRFISTALLLRVTPRQLLTGYGLANVVLTLIVAAGLDKISAIALVGVFFFMSAMFATIFALGVHGLGASTKRGASIMVMAIGGGVLLPWPMGKIAEAYAPLPSQPSASSRIDREALVRRHSVVLTKVDRHAPVMLGNGDLGFTADITGLQTFPEQYSELSPLLTMAQWAWHSFPNPEGYTEQDGLIQVQVPGRGEQPYAWMKSWAAAEANPAYTWLRANPHRFSLSRISLAFADGRELEFSKVESPRQTLDLWTGTLTSEFSYDGEPVKVVTRIHPDQDMVLVELVSPLAAQAGLAIRVRYPGVSQEINPDPTLFSQDDHKGVQLSRQSADEINLVRTIDETRFSSNLKSSGRIEESAASSLIATSNGHERLTLMVGFDQRAQSPTRPAFEAAVADVQNHWRGFWSEGGAVDFSGSADPRAFELERRVVLSQYLSAVNGAGELPPQEEGLFSNSWYGKFHLEMHPWHSGWQAMWGRPELLERSLPWYLSHLPRARQEAARHQ